MDQAEQLCDAVCIIAQGPKVLDEAEAMPHVDRLFRLAMSRPQSLSARAFMSPRSAAHGTSCSSCRR